MDVWKLVKLPLQKFAFALLLIGAGWLANQLTEKEKTIEKSTQRTEKKEDDLQVRVDNLNKQLQDQKDSCAARVGRKDAEMMALYRELLNDAKATKRKATQTERNVDRALDQTRQLNSVEK